MRICNGVFSYIGIAVKRFGERVSAFCTLLARKISSIWNHRSNAPTHSQASLEGREMTVITEREMDIVASTVQKTSQARTTVIPQQKSEDSLFERFLAGEDLTGECLSQKSTLEETPIVQERRETPPAQKSTLEETPIAQERSETLLKPRGKKEKPRTLHWGVGPHPYQPTTSQKPVNRLRPPLNSPNNGR